MGSECAAIFSNTSSPLEAGRPKHVLCEVIILDIPWAYFDRAAPQGLCGAGMVIHKNKNISFATSMGLASGANNFAELQTLKILLCRLLHKDITSIQICGDSLNVIKWFNKSQRCQNYLLLPILHDILSLKYIFTWMFAIFTENGTIRLTTCLKSVLDRLGALG